MRTTRINQETSSTALLLRSVIGNVAGRTIKKDLHGKLYEEAVDFGLVTLYSTRLVFGKTVRIRRYPVAVCAENLASIKKATGIELLGRQPMFSEA